MFCYSTFESCLVDDVDFRYGRKHVRKLRKKKGFWKKFLFLDIKEEVVPWHYVMFWISLISFAVAFVTFNTFIVCGNEAARIASMIAGGISFCARVIVSFVNWPLYIVGNWENTDQIKHEYRRKYRGKNKHRAK